MGTNTMIFLSDPFFIVFCCFMPRVELFAIIALVISQRIANVDVKLSGGDLTRSTPKGDLTRSTPKRAFCLVVCLHYALPVQSRSPKARRPVPFPPPPASSQWLNLSFLSPKCFSSSHLLSTEYWNGLIIPAFSSPDPSPELDWADWNVELPS